MYECPHCGHGHPDHICPGPQPTNELLPLISWTAEPFVSFDLAGAGLESVDVRPSAVVAVETDAKFPGTCVLRVNPNMWYRVDADVSSVLSALGASDE